MYARVLRISNFNCRRQQEISQRKGRDDAKAESRRYKSSPDRQTSTSNNGRQKFNMVIVTKKKVSNVIQRIYILNIHRVWSRFVVISSVFAANRIQRADRPLCTNIKQQSYERGGSDALSIKTCLLLFFSLIHEVVNIVQTLLLIKYGRFSSVDEEQRLTPLAIHSNRTVTRENVIFKLYLVDS